MRFNIQKQTGTTTECYPGKDKEQRTQIVDFVTRLPYLPARPSLEAGPLQVFILFFARPTDPPSQETGRWETKYFIGMVSQSVLGARESEP